MLPSLPQASAVSARPVPEAAASRWLALISSSTIPASHTQPEITLIPLWKEPPAGFSRTPFCPAGGETATAAESGASLKLWLPSCHTNRTCSPGDGKSGTRVSPLAPRTNSSPKVVTMKVARLNSTPSAKARMVCSPSPIRFQLNSSPKPLLPSSPQASAVSARPVPAAASRICVPSTSKVIAPLAHVQPEISTLLLWKESGSGFSRNPTKTVTVKVARSNSTPSAKARMVCWPAPISFQSTCNAKPTSAWPPQFPATSARLVRVAVPIEVPSTSKVITPWLHVQPEIRPVPPCEEP